MKNLARVLATVLLAGLVSLAPSAARTDEMTREAAADYYLSVACPANQASTRFSAVVYGADRMVYAREFRNKPARLRAVHRAAYAYALAIYRFAQRMQFPTAP